MAHLSPQDALRHAELPQQQTSVGVGAWSPHIQYRERSPSLSAAGMSSQDGHQNRDTRMNYNIPTQPRSDLPPGVGKLIRVPSRGSIASTESYHPDEYLDPAYFPASGPAATRQTNSRPRSPSATESSLSYFNGN